MDQRQIDDKVSTQFGSLLQIVLRFELDNFLVNETNCKVQQKSASAREQAQATNLNPRKAATAAHSVGNSVCDQTLMRWAISIEVAMPPGGYGRSMP